MFEALPTTGLVLLLGTPGSGKTVFAELAFAQDSLLSTDRWRAFVGGSADRLQVTPVAHGLLADVAEHRLAEGLLTVVDSTGTDDTLRHRLEQSAKVHAAAVHYVHVDAPLELCLRRNAERDQGRVPEPELRRIAERVAALVGELQAQGHRVSTAASFAGGTLRGKKVFLALPVAEFMGHQAFRRDRRQLCERIHAALELSGAVVSSAALNENYGSIRLSPREYTRYDIDQILAADCLLACTTSALSPDTYLEIGAAIGSGKAVGILLPERSHRSGMLRGLVELGSVASASFDSDSELPKALVALATRLMRADA